jgi:hypothetical protein
VPMAAPDSLVRLERTPFLIEGFGADRPPGSGVHALDGHVITLSSFGNAPALQLFSPQVAARENPHGFSGAPVLILALGGWVAVGIVRVARPLLEVSNDVSGQMIGGVVYATPVSEAAKLWPEVCKLVPTSFQAPTITDPNVAYRMVDEAAFAYQVRLWPGNKNVLEWVLRQLSRELENTVVLPPMVAHRMLEAAQRRAKELKEEGEAAQRRIEEESDYNKKWELSRADSGRAFRDVRAVINPVLEQLPDEREYLAALRRIDPNLLARALKAGYYKTRRDPDRGDYWMASYLELMKDLNEIEVLLGILKERFLSIPQGHEAYMATWALAKIVLVDDFRGWYEQEVGEWPVPPSYW